MEKILRKVKCFDRKPEIAGYYYTDCGEGKYDIGTKKFYAANKIVQTNDTPNIIHHITLSPSYWYEEVEIEDDLDLNDIFELLPIFKDKNYSLTDKISIILNKHDRGIFEDTINHVDVNNDIKLLLEVEARERYGKALKFIHKETFFTDYFGKTYKVNTITEILKALKMAAGLGGNMNSFIMKYTWDDPEQAAYAKTISFICNGQLKTRKLENETDEEFKHRSEKSALDKLRIINVISSLPALVTLYEFY